LTYVCVNILLASSYAARL